MKRSTKTILTLILLVTLIFTTLLIFCGCGLVLLVAISESFAVVDGVHYSLNTSANVATVEYFDADKTLGGDEKQVCVVPEKIKHLNQEYTVTAIGSYESTMDIIDGGAQIGELVLPKTVRSVHLNIYRDIESLEKITVAEDNPTFFSKDGALFNNTYYGYYLEYYPLGKTDDTFEFPAQYAGNYSHSNIWYNEYLQNLEIESGSELYTSINGALYSKDGETLMLYPVQRKDTTFVAPKGMKRIDLNSNIWNNSNITQVEVEADSKYLKVEDNVLYSLDGSELLYRPNDGKTSFAIPSSVKVVSYNSLHGVENLYVPNSVVVFLDVFVYQLYNIAYVNNIYFESDTLPKYLRDVTFDEQQLHFGVSRESFDTIVGSM